VASLRRLTRRFICVRPVSGLQQRYRGSGRALPWIGHVARMEQMRNANSILVEKPEGKKPLGRPKH